MKIQVLTSPGCDHGKRALALVADVVRQTAPGAEVETIFVATAEDAARLSFPGSPTIRVNGLDIDPQAPTGVGLGWRLYGLAGVPPRTLIEAAIRSCGPAWSSAARRASLRTAGHR